MILVEDHCSNDKRKWSNFKNCGISRDSGLVEYTAVKVVQGEWVLSRL